MIYVLKIDDKVISKLKENELQHIELQYKELKLSCHKNWSKCFVIYVATGFRATRLYELPKNNEIKYLCYHEEKNTTCCLETHIFYLINNIIDEYKYITLDDFSVVNH